MGVGVAAFVLVLGLGLLGVGFGSVFVLFLDGFVAVRVGFGFSEG